MATVADIKLKVKELTGFHPTRQYLKYARCEHVYEDDNEQLNITSGHCVTLFILSEHTNNSFLLGQPRTPADHKKYMLPYRAPITLFCFPCLGGSANSQFGEWASLWSRSLGSVGSCVAVEYPGHGNDTSELIGDMDQLANHLVESLGLRSLRQPFALLGHSMGAMVAYEVARILQQHSITPVALFAVAQMAPFNNVPDWRVDVSDDEFIASLIAMGGLDEQLVAEPAVRDRVIQLCRNDNTLEHLYAQGYCYYPLLLTTCQDPLARSWCTVQCFQWSSRAMLSVVMPLLLNSGYHCQALV